MKYTRGMALLFFFVLAFSQKGHCSEVFPSEDAEVSIMKSFLQALKTTNPHDLEDMRGAYNDAGDLEGEAQAFVAAALYGVTDYQNHLFHLDENALQYMRDHNYEGLDELYQALLAQWNSD